MSDSLPQSIPLLGLTHLRFAGPDAERYLNGQVTQQVAGLAIGDSRYTFVCDAKGRVLFDASIYRDEEGFLLSIAGGVGEEHFARMDRYLIADDCELSDESERWTILHEPINEPYDGDTINRFGFTGKDRFLEGETKLALSEKAPSHQELENLRLLHAVPRLADLQGALPAETDREDQAVSFHKGCYLGQEVISRMKRAGKTNRKLTSVLLSETNSDLPLLFRQNDSDKTLLEVTSVSTIACESGYPALGYLSTRVSDLSGLTSPQGITASLKNERNL